MIIIKEKHGRNQTESVAAAWWTWITVWNRWWMVGFESAWNRVTYVVVCLKCKHVVHFIYSPWSQLTIEYTLHCCAWECWVAHTCSHVQNGQFPNLWQGHKTDYCCFETGSMTGTAKHQLLSFIPHAVNIWCKTSCLHLFNFFFLWHSHCVIHTNLNKFGLKAVSRFLLIKHSLTEVYSNNSSNSCFLCRNTNYETQ